MSENQSMGGSVQEVDVDDGGFFGVFASKQSYLNIAYLLLSFPLGIFYFIFLTVGFSLGVGLSILGIGLIILLAMLIATRGLAAWERQLGIWLLGAHIPPPNSMPEPWRHPLMALKKYLTDSYTWKSLIYLVVKFPLAITSFVIAISLTSATAALLLAPLMYRLVPLTILRWRITRAEEALLCVAVGLVLGLISVHIMNGLAAVCRAFATMMLAGTPPQRGHIKTGPIVIP